MNVTLTKTERRTFRQLQKQGLDDGYVRVIVIMRAGKGHPQESIADDLDVVGVTSYLYMRAFATLGLAHCLAPQCPGYWGRFNSAYLACPCYEVSLTLHMQVKAIQNWVFRYCHMRYWLLGLTSLSRQLNFNHKITTHVPYQTDAVVQQGFLQELPVLEAHAEWGEAVPYYSDAASLTMTQVAPAPSVPRCQEPSLLTVSGRKRVNLGAECL